MWKKTVFVVMALFFVAFAFTNFVAFAAEVVIDNTQPVVVVVRPTTASPNSTNETSPNFEIVFNYTEANPNNWSLIINNATHTICTHHNTSALTGGTNITITTNCSISSITEGTYNLTVNVTDIVLNSSTGTETGAIIADFTVPVLSNPVPANGSDVNTSQITLGVDTNEVATCRFATSASVSYYDMTTTFANTQSTSHTTTVNLTDFGIYNFYIRCQDNAGNANNNDFLVSVNFVSNASAFGRSVTLNLAFRIGAVKGQDAIQFTSRHIAAWNTNNGTVLGIVPSGERNFISNFNTSYSSSAYVISNTQALKENIFLVTYTNGTNADVRNKASFLGGGKILGTIFGSIARETATGFPLYIVTFYDDADLQNNTDFSGTGKLMIRNRGDNEFGVPNITIERI